MATIKSFTDLQQSKKLAEILPIESADMHYNNASIKGINYVDEYRAELMDYDTAQKVLSKYLVNPMFGIIPCWSLAALLSVASTCCSRLEITLRADKKYNVFAVKDDFVFRSFDNHPDGFDNLVDACVAMIEKLHELNLL